MAKPILPDESVNRRALAAVWLLIVLALLLQLSNVLSAVLGAAF